MLNASQVAVENGHGALISVDVERERCWKYAPGIGGDKTFATPCSACGEALREMLEC